ncbi:YadA-like family protein [Enterobacter sp. ku-bf2]|uniref:YadA C-terminal domain-containing protein n=1 Tax=Enterobacter sp. ku-bf2 TaxID=1888167 RepID=UPI000A3E9AD8|nr:YadA-like family protein [Enterobacter sp. ku-bf2]
MKPINKSAVVVFGCLFAGIMVKAHAATLTVDQYNNRLNLARSLASDIANDYNNALRAYTAQGSKSGTPEAQALDDATQRYLHDLPKLKADIQDLTNNTILAPNPIQPKPYAVPSKPQATPTKQPQAIPQPQQLIPQPLPQPTKQPQAIPPQHLVMNVPLKQFPQTNTPVNSPLVAVQTFPTTTITNTPVTAPAGVVVINGVDGKDGKNGSSIAGKRGAMGATGAVGAAGKNGLNGSNGANGVTTIITKHEVDQITKNNVAANRSAINANRSAINAMNQQINSQFKSLKSEVDDNKKQANAGISGAMAMAGLPQVQVNKKVMFSAGAATYEGESALAVGASVNFNDNVIAKVSFSDDTANNMGASVGVGIGF